MTFRPIPGAPIGAPIPDFPTGEPGPLVVPASRFTRRPVGPFPFSLPPPAPAPTLSPARRPGPVEIRGSGDSTLTFRSIPEIPAINRSRMTISVTGEPTGDHSPRMISHLDLSTDEAKAFLLALRDGAHRSSSPTAEPGFRSNLPLRKTGLPSPSASRVSSTLATVQRWVELRCEDDGGAPAC